MPSATRCGWIHSQSEQRTRRGRSVTVAVPWEPIVRRRPNPHLASRPAHRGQDSVPAPRCSSASSAVRATITAVLDSHGSPALPTTIGFRQGSIRFGANPSGHRPSLWMTIKDSALTMRTTRRPRWGAHQEARQSSAR
jgi:hypothetical protein